MKPASIVKSFRRTAARMSEARRAERKMSLEKEESGKVGRDTGTVGVSQLTGC